MCSRCVLSGPTVSADLSAGVREVNIGNPVALAPVEALFFALALEGGRRSRQQRSIHTLEGVHVDDRVEAAIDAAGDERHHAAIGADVELRRLRAEGVARGTRRFLDRNLQRTGRARRPYPTVLGAERAGAGARRNLRRLRLPIQRERDVPAVATSVDQHGRSPLQRDAPNLIAALARARVASTSRLRGSAVVTSERMRARAAVATSSMARSKAASLALEGTLKPLSLRTNCSEASRISSSVAGGSKLNKVLMLRHMAAPARGEDSQW